MPGTLTGVRGIGNFQLYGRGGNVAPILPDGGRLLYIAWKNLQPAAMYPPSQNSGGPQVPSNPIHP